MKITIGLKEVCRATSHIIMEVYGAMKEMCGDTSKTEVCHTSCTMTKVCGATSCMMAEVGGTASHIMKVCGTKSTLSNSIR